MTNGLVHGRRGWRERLPLLLILATAAALRLYGLNWDGGQWLHPDERQIYFIALELGWPRTLGEALSPASPLNPHFFAYGSLPFYLLRLVAALLAPVWPALRDPDNLHLVGRLLAVLFDLGTVFLTYRLARAIWPPPRGGETTPDVDSRCCAALLAAGLVAVATLHVQLAHFYTADPLLTCLVLLTLNLAADVARGAGLRHQAALGLAFGLALATKVNAALLIVAIYAAYTLRFTGYTMQEPIPTFAIPRFSILRRVVTTLAVAGVVFLLAEPYAVIDWRTFVADTTRESQIAWGQLDVPYTRQYVGTLPYLYSVWQLALWGLGPILGLVAWAALAASLFQWLRRGEWATTLLLAWAGPYLALTGALHARHLRYMLPLVPILCILTVRILAEVKPRVLRALGHWVLVIGSLASCTAFLTIYAAPHSWITASEWIYRHVPAGSTLAVEEWDTPLPLAVEVNGQPRRIEEYEMRTLPLYDEPDDAHKWTRLAAALADSDYLIIASRRLYGSIPRLPERYPITSRYYRQLSSGELGFELVGEFLRGPAWLNPRLPPLPGAAPALLRPDESFVVYDHPRALVFRNRDHLSSEELLLRLQVPPIPGNSPSAANDDIIGGLGGKRF